MENAGLPAPPGLDATHPADLEPERLLDAAEALGRVLTGLRDDHGAGDLEELAESVRRRFSALRSTRPSSADH